MDTSSAIGWHVLFSMMLNCSRIDMSGSVAKGSVELKVSRNLNGTQLRR